MDVVRLAMFNQLKFKVMKIYVLTEIDLAFVGFSPKTVQTFPTYEKAVEEMKNMYAQALERFKTTEEDKDNVLDEGIGYASIGMEYKLDIFECECEFEGKFLRHSILPTMSVGALKEILKNLSDDKELVAYDLNDRHINITDVRAGKERVYLDLGAVTTPSLMTVQEITIVADKIGVREMLMDGTADNLSRDEVWVRMQEWAKEFDESHKDFDYYAHNTSFYDEIDSFVEAKKVQLENPYERRTAPMDSDLLINPKDAGGDDKEVCVRLHIVDGSAMGPGVRMKFPKLDDLTPDQIKEMDEYLGGRISDSKYICVEDVAIWAGKITCFGIMDTGNGHHEDLVRRINVAWVRCKKEFEPILKALYERDIDEICGSDAFAFKADDSMETNLEEMRANWDYYAYAYLQHIADNNDLSTILHFLNYSNR